MARSKGRTNTGYSLEERPRTSGKPAWRVRILVDGKSRIVGTFANKGEAQREGANAVAQRQTGTLVKPDKLTVGELLDRWLIDVAAPKVKATTLEDYRYTVDRYIKPRSIVRVRVQALIAADLRAFYSELRGAGVGARTIQLCHLRLAQALKFAAADGIVPRAVTDRIESPSAVAKRGDPWSVEEAQRLLAIAEDEATYRRPTKGEGTRNPRPAELALLPLWRLALETGMRKGELLGLRWRDVDLDRRVLRVEQTVTVLDAKAIIAAPKTEQSRRTVAITPETVEALREHRKRWLARQLAAEEWADADLVFCTDQGRAIHPSNVDRAFPRLVKVSGVRRIRFHDLRHTAATWLLQAKQPVPAVAAQLGHANAGITARVYSHLVNGQQEEAATVMSALLSSKRVG